METSPTVSPQLEPKLINSIKSIKQSYFSLMFIKNVEVRAEMMEEGDASTLDIEILFSIWFTKIAPYSVCPN